MARITITTDKDNKQMMGFTLPLGVALEAGMGLQIGKDPVKVYPVPHLQPAGLHRHRRRSTTSWPPR